MKFMTGFSEFIDFVCNDHECKILFYHVTLSNSLKRI